MRKQDAYELVGSTKSRLDEAERDRMDLKMEVAHLRERLLQRVGGDTTALELEEESFAMKRELMQMERSLAEYREKLLGANTKNEKALMNLQKMDAAWKASVGKIKSLQEELHAKDKQLLEVDALKKQVHVHEFTIQTLEGSAKQLQVQLSAKDATILELKGENKRMQVEFDEVNRQLNVKAGSSKDAQREAEGELQVMVEKSARLQGEANALREELSHLRTHSLEVEANATSLKAKLLQLTEDHATLQIHLSASKQDVDRHAGETRFFKGEMERLQNELTARDHQLLQQQQQSLDVQSAIEDTKKKLHMEEAARELQTRRMELDVEKKWRDQAHAYEAEIQAQASALAMTTDQLEAAKALQDELTQVLGIDDATQLQHQVATELKHKAALVETVEKLRSKLTTAERACAELSKLQRQHTELEEKYTKTRQAMERIVTRKSKPGAVVDNDLIKENLQLLRPAKDQPKSTKDTVVAMQPKVSPPGKESTTVVYQAKAVPPATLVEPTVKEMPRPAVAAKENVNTLLLRPSLFKEHLNLKAAPSFVLKRKAPSSTTADASRPLKQLPTQHVVVKSRYLQPPKHL
ncbi:Aste57867_16553 [Aphanomyces stellatus]|uniref:Aste57867_16553 protein n=1 Tax=Aphanomyces stellatus TaxID=120398 RepID=A0A485L5P9_9STRA|nr:hypothetical protein As57867_016496 [Aphanomyces stellatus]VFT93327.1 Aste57867_16553 [Aphanomyces stellatus]